MRKSGNEREMPHTDQLMIILPLIFVFVTLADVMTSFSTFLGFYVEFWLKSVMGFGMIIGGIVLIIKTHRILFNKAHVPPKRVISSGIFGRMRHPLYFGIILIYIGVFLMTFSLIGLALLVGYFFLYDKMATFEETVLEELFGDDYREYKKIVPKWFPLLRA